MTGQTWVISILVAMLRYGEDAVTPDDVVAVAGELFPNTLYAADSDQASIMLREQRRHVIFVREGPAKPTIHDMLSWAARARRGASITLLDRDVDAVRAQMTKGSLDVGPRQSAVEKPLAARADLRELQA
jgi:hypothetical protein